MNKPIEISASILAADFSQLAHDIRRCEAAREKLFALRTALSIAVVAVGHVSPLLAGVLPTFSVPYRYPAHEQDEPGTARCRRLRSPRLDAPRRLLGVHLRPAIRSAFLCQRLSDWVLTRDS